MDSAVLARSGGPETGAMKVPARTALRGKIGTSRHDQDRQAGGPHRSFQDNTKVAPKELLTTSAVKTYVGGGLVYEKGKK